MDAIQDIIEPQLHTIAQACRQHGVRRLELFGSASQGTFDPAHSDLDFLVEFDNLTIVNAADRYFGMLFALEDLFRRRIDLVELSAVSNPYFLQAIAPTRRVLYAA